MTKKLLLVLSIVSLFITFESSINLNVLASTNYGIHKVKHDKSFWEKFYDGIFKLNE
ncbi:hypothetical protein [Apilactobacillus timberlakei]|uniref:hypothetical protein n=1 Tax=Apilactobacillus timberlakei TaxID=2008380 RepID=UPI00142E2FBF|nr:hypothetical protein [Apilactobacillus timberlakei]